jgi:hypothetical protein
MTLGKSDVNFSKAQSVTWHSYCRCDRRLLLPHHRSCIDFGSGRAINDHEPLGGIQPEQQPSCHLRLR